MGAERRVGACSIALETEMRESEIVYKMRAGSKESSVEASRLKFDEPSMRTRVPFVAHPRHFGRRSWSGCFWRTVLQNSR